MLAGGVALVVAHPKRRRIAIDGVRGERLAQQLSERAGRVGPGGKGLVRCVEVGVGDVMALERKIEDVERWSVGMGRASASAVSTMVRASRSGVMAGMVARSGPKGAVRKARTRARAARP